MSQHRSVVTLVVALTLTLGTAGCGSSSSGSSQSTPATASTASSTPTATGGVRITMKNIAFAPKAVTVKVGQRITWTNGEAIEHNVKADTGATFMSDLLAQGKTYSYTPTKPGTITYECTIHPGMVGTIDVR